MARLRIRIELSRGGVGVPLHKLASVVEEAQRFFEMLAADVNIDGQRGEWLGFDFDNQSLNFTAEYVGAVTRSQAEAFYEAFDGTTALHRATIAQFARIADAIGQDELIGFGLYPSEQDAEPSEWRCLSRRDALRIAEEIDVLLSASSDQASHLPAVRGASANFFGRSRDDEHGLAERLSRVERKVDQHATQLQDMRSQSAAAEESFRNLLSAVENFCEQATRQIERVSPQAIGAPRRSSTRWLGLGLGIVAAVAIVAFTIKMWPVHPPQPVTAQAAPPRPIVSTPAPEPAPPPRPQPMRIEVASKEPSWVSMTDGDDNRLYIGLLSPGNPRTFELDQSAKLRTGNAGGIEVKLNGKPLGSIGARGQIREVEFKDNAFKITTPQR